MIKSMVKDILTSGFKFWQVLVIVTIVGLLSPAVPATLDYFFWQKRQEYTLSELFNSGTIVNATLQNIQTQYGANRVFLGEFYNGTHFTSGNPLARFLLTYEITSLGTAPLPMPFREMPVSYASDVFKAIQDFGILEYTPEEMTNSVFRNMMSDLNLSRLYLFSVHDPLGNLVGVMGLDFKKDDKILSPEDQAFIRARVETLSGFLLRS